MYKNLFLSFSFMFCVCAVFVGVWRCVVIAVFALQSQVLVCDELVYDFGVVQLNEQLEHDFLLRNNSDGLVRVTSVAPGCGSCVKVVSFPLEPIQPHGYGIVKLRLLTQEQSGEIAKDVILKSDHPKVPYLILTLKATLTQ